MRIHEIQPNHPSTTTARHDKWLRDLIARTQASAAEREREAASVTEAQPKTIKPIKPTKPKTPDQQRIATMKANAKRADQAVQAERARQQQRTAQQALVKAQQTIAAA